MIQAILPSNQLQIQHAIDQIVETGKKRVGLLGFSFKAGTDDLRESPIVILAEALLGKGFELRIYDKNVSLARLVGANKEYIEQADPAPVVAARATRSTRCIEQSDVIVVGNRRRSSPRRSARLPRRSDRHRPGAAAVEGSLLPAEYRGICW